MISESVRDQIQQSYRQFLKQAGYKARYGQKHMIAEIARGLNHSRADSRITVVEAGTGTGKTLAYVLAGLVSAQAAGKSLVVSTATIALQEQLIYKDLPDILEKSGLSFSYALVKGRGRYMCQAKLERSLADDSDQMAMYLDGASPGLTSSTVNLYQELSIAVNEGRWDGDRDTWPDTIQEDEWRPLTSDRFQCTGRHCPHVNECAFFRAREELQDVSLLVTNHDLILADLALGGGAILPSPEDAMYIFDEAHHLSDKARSHFASRCRIGAAQSFLQQMGEQLPSMQRDLTDISNITNISSTIETLRQEIVAAILPVKQAALAYAEENLTASDSHSNLGTDIRFQQGLPPSILLMGSDALAANFERISFEVESLTERLEKALSGKISQDDRRAYDAWFAHMGQWQNRLQGYAALWSNYRLALGATDTQQFARWMRFHASADDIELFSSPIVPGDILDAKLWQRCSAAVLTSATLRALGKFDRLLNRVGLPATTPCSSYLSPFDYANAARLQIPINSADPKDAYAHDQYIIDTLPKLLNQERSVLVLFSSGRQMDCIFDAMSDDLQRKILIQGTRSKQRLIELHRQRIDDGKSSYIFGLASFAEGIDLRGDYCQHVVISKIPFSVPSDPEEEALAEWVEAQGRSAFGDISLPDASVRLVQATGRLLRADTDTGVITIFDNRLLNKSYGKQLVRSLPPYPVIDHLQLRQA